MNTLARHSAGPLHAPQHHPYLSGTVVGHMATLRRQPLPLHHTLQQQQHQSLDESMPKSLSRGATNAQYYYG